MELAVNIFESHFAHWSITIPIVNIEKRQRGEIKQDGWYIQYLFGIDADGEYIDYYASHRMTDDNHTRIRVDGRQQRLETMQSMFVTSTDENEAKKLEDEYFQRNRKLGEMLRAKGFLP